MENAKICKISLLKAVIKLNSEVEKDSSLKAICQETNSFWKSGLKREKIANEGYQRKVEISLNLYNSLIEKKYIFNNVGARIRT